MTVPGASQQRVGSMGSADHKHAQLDAIARHVVAIGPLPDAFEDIGEQHG